MNINASIRKLTLLFVALFIGLSAGLVYWQVIVAQQVTANPHNSRGCLNSNAPIRGKIYDRNGVLLADTRPNTTGGCGYTRHYYDPSLAGLIGYYVAGYPATGIEAKYDDYLSGRKGLTALDNTINQTLHRPPVGDNIYLTIDERIQKIVDRDFDTPIVIDNVNTFKSDRGSIIVTDPHTGEVLAMLSRPYFDPNQMVATLSAGDTTFHDKLAADTKENALLERPIQSTYIPGSTYKTMTLVAALDSGNTTLNEEFDQAHALGPIRYNDHNIGPVGNNIQDYTIHFPVTTEYGFSHSDNIIYAQIGVKTGAQTWLDYNKRFYVGEQIPFDLPVQPSSVLNNGQPLRDVELASNAFGQGFDAITPMQMSVLDDAIANDGQLMRPLLVQKIVDTNQTQIEKYDAQPLGSAQMSQQTARAMRQAMLGVVQCGSGSLSVVKLGTSPYTIIGKTGTAEVGGGLGANAWLITQAPYALNDPSVLPKLTIVAMKENAGEGGAATGPMITRMYNDIFNSIIKVKPPTPPPFSYCCSTKLLQIGCA
ncbi:MAG: penicillin-binding transpeptidase domain-containing protein [Ktedonobacteraceae bacterium]